MEVSLGFFESPENILIRKFSLNKEFLSEETLGLNDLSTCNLDGLFISSKEINEEVLDKLKEELNFFPIFKSETLSLNFSDFKNLNPLMALSKLAEISRPWALKNNLFLIENLFEIVNKLKKTIHQNREFFLKELYYLVKNNIGANNMVLYFNDLDNRKNQIIKRKISGKKYSEILELTEADKKILETLEGTSGPMVFYKDKQEFLIKVEIFGSPVILVGRCFSFSPLQKAILKSLFKGLE